MAFVYSYQPLFYHICFAYYSSKLFTFHTFESKSIITKWFHAIIHHKVRFITFYCIFCWPCNMPVHIAHSWLHIFCMLFILSAIYCRTLAHVATVFCWLYPTLNKFILSYLILSYLASMRHIKTLISYVNPVYGVATICHQVRWLRWGIRVSFIQPRLF